MDPYTWPDWVRGWLTIWVIFWWARAVILTFPKGAHLAWDEAILRGFWWPIDLVWALGKHGVSAFMGNAP